MGYTQSNGRRPFGLSALVVGVDYDGTPNLYQTDPSGTYHAWKANAIGRSSKTVRDLLEVVQSGSKSMEIAVMRRDGKGLEVLKNAEVDRIIGIVEKDKADEAESKQKGKK